MEIWREREREGVEEGFFLGKRGGGLDVLFLGVFVWGVLGVS